MNTIPIRRRRSSNLPARSHFVTRPDSQESPTHAITTGQQVRRETMSWTYRELSQLDTFYSKTPQNQASSPVTLPIFNRRNERLENLTERSIENLASTDMLLAEEERPLLSTTVREPKIPAWKEYFYAIPAVILALMLTLLDAMSYGIIIFPGSDPHIPSTGPQAGVSMFLASTVISQIVFTAGGSAFKGAVGSMMIEVMPFLHIICATVEAQLAGSSDAVIMATIMAAYACSTIITGIVFLLLGYYKLGNVIQFFPRHILVGCIGGIGLFLILTGIEVTAKIEPVINLHYLTEIFRPEKLLLWGSSLMVALTLKGIQVLIEHPMLVPVFYAIIPVVFYVFVYLLDISLQDLRTAGWLFNFDMTVDVPFYTFWTYFDFSLVKWSALAATLPTQFALTFFGILHVPINVPALAVSTKQDVDLSQEIIGHGISNIISGLFGATQNYLVYSNSLLYIRSGGSTQASGILLILTTILLWVKGSFLIAYVPTIVVGALIFHLGIDLMKESIYDTWSVGMHPFEYFTIVTIVVTMGLIGFTEGVIVGAIMACMFFVVMYSQKSIIRETFSGADVRSTVHRLYRQQRFLDKVGHQTKIIKLQGFMFFGTVNQLDQFIIKELAENPKMRFVVLDFSLISGVDYSGLETFLRIKRHLMSNKTHLVLCGLGNLEKEIRSVGLLDHEEDEEIDSNLLVHIFEGLNEALEWSENYLLTRYYTKTVMSAPKVVKTTSKASVFDSTPRAAQIDFAANEILRGNLTLTQEYPLEHSESFERIYEPFRFMVQSMADQRIIDEEMVSIIGPEFEKQSFPKGHIIYKPGQDSNGLYIVDDGELGLTSKEGESFRIVETLLPGIMVGELELFSGRSRVCTLICLSDVTVWYLSRKSYEKLCKTHPSLMLKFVTRIAIPFDTVRMYNTIHHWFLGV